MLVSVELSKQIPAKDVITDKVYSIYNQVLRLESALSAPHEAPVTLILDSIFLVNDKINEIFCKDTEL